MDEHLIFTQKQLCNDVFYSLPHAVIHHIGLTLVRFNLGLIVLLVALV